MIGIVAHHAGMTAATLVLAAVRRSTGAVLRLTPSLEEAGPDVAFLVDSDVSGADLAAWRSPRSRKLVVFGRLPQTLQVEFAFEPAAPMTGVEASCNPALPGQTATSLAEVHYTALAEGLGGHPWRRPLVRFDFLDEWNLHGYGPIRNDGSIWSIGPAIQSPQGMELATIPGHGSYAALIDTPELSVLWFNRPVGVIDSFEWRLVEIFLAHHRAGEGMPCVPVLREIPHGYDTAVTMRLDCDEDVATALPLMELYRSLAVPFSIAVATHLLTGPRNSRALQEMAKAGCAILSHSATHPHHWGVTSEAALAEAATSADAIAEAIGRRPRHAVSPFHETPSVALAALAQAGYSGCIGGSVKVNPEFSLARGGRLDGLPEDFVGHSQQCMLHGDCPPEAALGAFDLAYDTATLFGYLDHPFSERYQYGWQDEAQRAALHERLVAHVRDRARRPIFLDEDAAMDFLMWRARARVALRGDGTPFVEMPPGTGGLELALEYRGEVLSATALRVAA